MSFNLTEAFRAILKMQKTPATIERIGELAEVNISIAPSNYFRDFNSVEEIPIRGNEFVIDVNDLEGTSYSAGPLRGDSIVSSIYGTVNIEEVREMVIMGKIVAYRVRTTK